MGRAREDSLQLLEDRYAAARTRKLSRIYTSAALTYVKAPRRKETWKRQYACGRREVTLTRDKILKKKKARVLFHLWLYRHLYLYHRFFDIVVTESQIKILLG